MSLSRTVALAAALLCVGLNAAAQEPRRFDVFAGGGVLHLGSSTPTVQVGGGVWVTPHWRVGARLENGGLLGLLSTHLRAPIDDGVDLLVGATPVWYSPGNSFVLPVAEIFVSGRAVPRLRVEFGAGFTLLAPDGGFIHWMGRAVYSFD
ncbi:MAG: hypothetical protein OXG35_26580 [Acidobacteria bacterium]|nr:hypothetical protein [Acidobacteriota bacterium]